MIFKLIRDSISDAQTFINFEKSAREKVEKIQFSKNRKKIQNKNYCKLKSVKPVHLPDSNVQTFYLKSSLRSVVVCKISHNKQLHTTKLGTEKVLHQRKNGILPILQRFLNLPKTLSFKGVNLPKTSFSYSF